MQKLQGLFVGTLCYPPQSQMEPQQVSFNFGPDGLVIVGSRMEAPLINPAYPQLGQDTEGVGQGRYLCRDDGKVELMLMM